MQTIRHQQQISMVVAIADLLEYLFGAGIFLVLVRVVLERESPVSTPDVLLLGMWRNFECFV